MGLEFFKKNKREHFPSAAGKLIKIAVLSAVLHFASPDSVMSQHESNEPIRPVPGLMIDEEALDVDTIPSFDMAPDVISEEEKRDMKELMNKPDYQSKLLQEAKEDYEEKTGQEATPEVIDFLIWKIKEELNLKKGPEV